jgi:hypothetical protein
MKKGILLFLVLILMASIIGYTAVNEKLPIGTNPEKADSLAREMLLAINDSAWQATEAVEWNFMGQHQHLWDKKRHFARVQWKKYEVFVDINKQTGVAYKNGILLEGDENQELVDKAWKFWVNDAFWLNPVSKAFDGGTTRTMVNLKKGQTGLMVSYSSGGNTPGDSYVWLLDENNLPTAWKMWVSIIPFGGLKIPWNGWITTETGVKICATHDTKIIDLKLKEVKTAFSLLELTNGVDVFKVLE